MKGWLALFCVAGVGCEGSCRSEPQLATLTQLSGSEVERDDADGVGSWRAARLSDGFFMGDGLRTGHDSRAQLGLLPDGTAQIGPRTVLRFLPRAPQARSTSVALEQGALELSAEQMDLEVHTPRAVARVARGGKLKLSAAEGRERFDLVVGRVQVVHEGTTRTLEPAHTLELGELAAPEASPAARAPAPEVTAIDASAEQAPQAWPRPSPSSADLVLTALERATVHAAHLPLDVYLPPPSCLEPKILINGKPLATYGLARLSAGQHRIRLLCGSRKVRESLLSVRNDPARAELPKHAQQVRVEADGRHYTVRYQNLLPTVSFVWPDAPNGDLFTLVLRKSGHEASYQVTEPQYVLSGDALSEGEFKFWFLDGHGGTSKTGTLRISFDNTARSAYLSSPPEGSAVTGDRVLVAGATLSRSQVSVDGQTIHIDDKGRFRAETPVVPGQRAVVVRIAHPESGVHYYLRKLR
jgi:hypothetical protein